MFPFSNNKSLRSLYRVWAKKWVLFQKPWGSTVQVYCFSLVSGFCHSKAKKCWDSGARGMEKKASFSFRTKNHFASRGTWAETVYGSATNGWIGITASLIILTSCTNWYSPEVFKMDKMGVLKVNLQGFKSSWVSNSRIMGLQLDWIWLLVGKIAGVF